MAEIIRANHSHLEVIHTLAPIIWAETYSNLLADGQVAYMLDMMYSMEVLQDLYQKENYQFIMVSEDERFIGFALYHPKNNSSSIYRLDKIYLLKSGQGKGTGKAMINYISNDTRLQGASFLQLNVNRQNPAVGFYRKLGFVITGEEDLDIGNGYFMNDYIMQLHLNKPVDESA